MIVLLFLAAIPAVFVMERADSEAEALAALDAFGRNLAADQERRFIKTFDPIGQDVRARLLASNWPGNVRELQNIVRRAVVMSAGPELTMATFAGTNIGAEPVARQVMVNHSVPQATAAEPTADAFASMTLDEIERWAIEAAVSRAGGSLRKAAHALGLSPSTLYRKRERWLGASDSSNAA
ncbi:MAG: helix-turn-helix domain-containing protein [Sphingomonas sp.]